MTEIDWPPILGHCTFCDDIREELGGKRSYMGIYYGTMDIPADLPVQLPKLCIAIHYYEDVLIDEKPLTLMVYLPHDSDDAPSISVSLPSANRAEARNQGRENGIPRVGMIVPIQLAPFPITSFGDVRVRLRRGDDEIVRAGRLTIRRGEASVNPNVQTIAGSVDVPAAPPSTFGDTGAFDDQSGFGN